MADLGMTSDAARRCAETLLRSTGGRTVYLRVPAPASGTGVNEQVGLGTPKFQDAELSPAVFRQARPQAVTGGPRWELLVSAISVGVLAGTSVADARSLFLSATGVLVDDTLMEIESIGSSDLGGAPYVYRLVLQAPGSQSV